MAQSFAASEIVELGVQIEINGKDFYDVLCKQTTNKKAKEIFAYLRDQEKEHISAFRKILDSVHKYQPEEAYPAEYFSYMNSLAGTHIFTQEGKGKEMAEGLKGKDEKEAVLMGIGFEKESITFYEGMKKIVPPEERSMIDRLIKEENDHLKQLTELKEGL